MPLPSIFDYLGWKIRYSLTTSNNKSSGNSNPKSIVFVHGTPWSSAVFAPTINALQSKCSYQILTYDLPGYGQSQTYTSKSNTTFPNDFIGDTSVKFQAEALAALLHHVKIDGKDNNPSPSIIAHDIAGTIVLRAHLIHGCEFEKMMLMDANTVLPWGDGFYKLARDNPKPFIDLPAAIYEAMLRAVIRSASHDPRVLLAGWEDVLAGPWLDGSDQNPTSKERQISFVRQIAQANDGDVAEMLDVNMYRQIRCSVRVLWGEQDQWIPREKIERFVELCAGRVDEVVVIPQAGHLVMLDQPARVAIEIYAWLT